MYCGNFPHYLCYVPAMVMLLQWCEDIYRSIYFYHNITGQGKKSLPGKLGKPVLILGVLVLGCVLEAFVNPVLFKGFLQFLKRVRLIRTLRYRRSDALYRPNPGRDL